MAATDDNMEDSRVSSSAMSSNDGSEWEKETLLRGGSKPRPVLRLTRLNLCLIVASATLISNCCLLAFAAMIWPKSPPHPSSSSQQACETDDLPLDKDAIMNRFDRSYHTVTFPAWNYTNPPHTVPPNGESYEESRVDQLWTELGVHSNFITIPVSQGPAHGLDIHRHVILPEKINGEDHFIATIEVVHHLHCLNMLRQNLWYQRDWYKEHHESDAAESLKIIHINHCLDNLRHRLMCTADRGLVPWTWASAPSGIVVDFERAHRCRNAQPILDWAIQNQYPDKPKAIHFKMPKGAYRIPWEHFVSPTDPRAKQFTSICSPTAEECPRED
ncbi:uncharacterized protein MYCFIDRAFT_202063 [Pseudocercospora fijiensis CIRAD86]|uniref:Tat pathway signal sequence n=1 Tax=Pseudocercospora fijiensis (strain CIRAD86) TaxID=383855 RepID=M3A270_PSEFD|nr:uncharacterized protein MYCFIDRAFT_202063 [Pseudocercospora fijiensis CIRAD86]EME85259.1 hypothetical protein MYCFIDRAFT_202063 [Pseudocercospora fijiensis CIRAD86]